MARHLRGVVMLRAAMWLNLPFGSDFVVSVSTQAHLARVSTLSGPGTRPVSGQLSPGPPTEGPTHTP